MMSKRNSYEVGFKLKVVAYSEKHGNRSAERKFGVSEKLVRQWRKGKDNLKEMPKTKRAARFSISPYQNLEKELYVWLVDLTNKGLLVDKLTIRNKALQLAPKYNVPQFKSSRGWCTRFMNRCKSTLRKKTQSVKKVPKIVLKKVPNSTKYVKKVPKDVNKKIHSSAKFNRKKREKLDCSLENVVSLEKESKDFDELGNSTIVRVKIEAEIEIDKDEVDDASPPHEMDSCVLKETLETSTLNKNTSNFTEELRDVIIKEENQEIDVVPVLTGYQQHVQVQKIGSVLVSDQRMQLRKSIHKPAYTGTKLVQRPTITTDVAAVQTRRNRFVCQTCKTIFYQRTSLMIHLAEHTVEKPFKCEVCHQRFHKSLSFRAHQAAHNRAQDSNACQEA